MTTRSTSDGGARRNAGPSTHPTGRTNTLGMTTQQLDEIYEQLDAHAGDASPRRHSSRLSFRQPSVGVDIIQPGGGQTHINVACRNLSRTGLGFLHSSYVHVGTNVVLTLRHQSLTTVRVPAKVMRCRHVTKNVHDVGVMFDTPIKVRDFLAMDPLTQIFTCEMVDPAQLKGTLLLVAEYAIEQACVRSMLTETAFEIVTATTVKEGLEKARKGVSVILCDDAFELESGPAFVAQARTNGIRCPIILMSAETSEEGLARIRKAKADAFLAKPLEKVLLLRAIAEFLLVSTDKSEAATSLHTTLAPDSPMFHLADSFVEDLHTASALIEKLVAAGDTAGVRRQCMRLGGPAASLGFEPIANLAQVFVGWLDATQSLEQSAMQVNTLIVACRGARKAPPPPPPAPVESTPEAGAHGASKPGEPAAAHAKATDAHKAAA